MSQKQRCFVLFFSVGTILERALQTKHFFCVFCFPCIDLFSSCTFFLEIVSFTFNRKFHFLIFLPLHSNSDHFSGKLFWWISKRLPKPSLWSRPKNLEDVCVSNHRQILNPSATSQTWPVHKNWDRNLISIFRWSNYRKKTTTVLRT